MVDPLHVVVVDDIPTPYRLALYRQIQALDKIRLTVLFLARTAREKQWVLDPSERDLSVRYAADLQYYIRALDTRVQLTWGIGRELRALAPDIIVTGGYHHIGYWRCLVHCRRHAIPLILWSGTTSTSEWRHWRLLRLMKRAYIAACTRYFAYGTAAARFLVALGAAPERVDTLYNTTDLRAFRDAWKAVSTRLATPEGPLRLIFVGRLTQYKGLQYVLLALARLAPRCAFSLRIVGDGHYRDALERQVDELGLRDRIVFAGYVQQAGLAEELAAADVFVFPPVQEVWGMVVNEALAAGLFVLSSTAAGVTEDLVKPGLSGIPFDPRSEESIERALAAALEDSQAIRAGRDMRSLWAMRFAAEPVARDFIAGVEAAAQETSRRRMDARWIGRPRGNS